MIETPLTPPPVGARRVFLILEDEPITFALVEEEQGVAEAATPSGTTLSSEISLTLCLPSQCEARS